MLTSPREIFLKAHELRAHEESFVLATVIAVHGSTSAKAGSKAIFDANSRNIVGYVGGGCAESFLAREAATALKERAPRIVSVDLDDEVFGLMPCGGTMDVYLEPYFPALRMKLAAYPGWEEPMRRFLQQVGFEAEIGAEDAPRASVEVVDWASAFVAITHGLAKSLDRPLRPLRELKGFGEARMPKVPRDSRQLLILGQTRITEELCRMARLLDWEPSVYAQNAHADSFPLGTAVCELPFDFSKVVVPKDARVVVASHHQQDHEFVAHALRSPASYVGLVASEKRSKLILEDMRKKGISNADLDRFFAPCGLSLPTETPTQIALSIFSEILYCQGRF